MENKGELKVVIESNHVFDNDMKEVVKLADEIRKEFNCNCTLVIKRI